MKTGPPGTTTPEQYVIALAKGIAPQQTDVLYAVERQKTRILERTLSGVDVDGAPFAPYSTNGPYYYYPNGRVGKNKFESRTNKSAVNRLLRKLGETISRKEAVGITNPGSGGAKTRNGEGIRFDSYADFKSSLGRVVDLMGPRAPHMLQAMQISVAWPEVEIGFYDDLSAKKAQGHNEGANRLPRRHFLGASESDLRQIETDIVTRIDQRLRVLI